MSTFVTAGTLGEGQGPGAAIALPSAARTTAQDVDFFPGVHDALLAIVLDITTYTAGGLTLTVQQYDPASNKFVTVLTTADKQATGTSIFLVGPHALPVTNVAAQSVLTPKMRVHVAVDDATSITYSVGLAAT